MRAKGIGVGVPINGLTIPNANQIGAPYPSEVTGVPAKPIEDDPPTQRSKPLIVERDGNNIHARTTRTKYHAVIGQTYKPFGDTIKDYTPKVLLAVGMVGDEWQVSIGPESGVRGRTRGMQRASFLTRYVKGTTIERVERVRPRGEGESRLARIERKLDLLLDQLGVKS